jgi:short-subunit dehydrogenase
MTMEGRGKTALVTGASAGIGEAFARELASHGFDLVLTARRRERLEALAAELEKKHGVRTLCVSEDLSDPQAPERLVAAIHAAGMRVDFLLNNAGYGVPGTFADTTWKEQSDFIQVLVTSGVHLAHLVLPGMIERGFGRIVNVASVAGLLPGTAGHTLYAASKSFMIKFSQSVALEHRGTGVSATAVCPGFTLSEFHDVVGNRSQVSKLPSFLWMTSADVASEGYAAAMRGDVVCVNGAVNRGLTTLTKLIPDRLALRIVASRSGMFRKR